MRAARIDLEALLRTRKLDNTLTSVLPAPDALPEQIVIPTGITALDERLHGGVPRGQISEIVGPRSSGRASLLVAMLAGVTVQGEMAALIDPLDMFDAASAAAGGVDLGRLLWVRGQGPGAGGQRTASREEAAVDRAIKALNLVLQAGGFGLVALDLAEVPSPVVRRLPFTTWLRLQRVIEGSETVCVLLATEPVARSAGGVTIALRPSGQWSAAGSQRHTRLFLGFDVEARLSRARWPETTPCRIRFGTTLNP
jgi:hypothetical protein